MKIAVAYTKQNPVGVQLCDAFCNGIIKQGDKVIQVKERQRLHDVDLVVQLCPYNIKGGTGPEIGLRKFIYDNYKGPLLIIDSGFFSQSNRRWTQEVDNRYFAVGLNGIKATAKYFTEDKANDSSRWDQLGITLKPYRPGKGNNILILGQHENGISTQHLKKGFIHWLEETITWLSKHTDKKILLRPHPNQREFPRCAYYHCLEKGNDIQKDLVDVYAVVAATTNGSTDAIINGLPLICDDKICVSFNMGNSSEEFLSDALGEHPLFFPSGQQRQEWLNELSWSQWSVKEMESGEVWKFWKDKIT
jgi:hypothetical protein